MTAHKWLCILPALWMNYEKRTKHDNIHNKEETNSKYLS